MSRFTVLGTAGPLEIGYGPGKVWVAGAFLSVADARELARLTGEAADQADEAVPAEEDAGAEGGLFL